MHLLPRSRLPSRYWTRRLTRHAIIAAASIAFAALLFITLESPQLVWRVSMATAYPGLLLVALSLVLGPLNVLRGRPNPVSFDLRRDLGIWGAVFSLVHVVAGIQVHFAGNMQYYFIFPPESRGWMPFRYDSFGLTNYSGLFATLAVTVLMALSNDLSLRRLGVARWKRLQQLNYIIFAAVIGHGVIYQLLEDRSAPWIGAVGGVALMVGALQLAGFRRVRRRSRSAQDA